MRFLLIFCLILSVSSCSLKEAIDNDFKTQTSVEPLGSSKTLAERFGNGENLTFTLKIPLTENSVGYYDVEDVLGNRNLNSSNKTFFSSLLDNLKLKFFNFFVGLGYYNKLKFSSAFNFPQVDSRFIKSAKVKKIFFTTEDCRDTEDNCNDRTSLGSNFNLVDKFFVNISANRKEANLFGTQVTELEDEEFEAASTFAFTQTPEKSAENMKKRTQAVDSEEENLDINLVKYSNNIPFVNLDISKSERSAYSNKMFIFRLDGNYIQAKKYFDSDLFKGVVKGSTMIGRSLYVEVRDAKSIETFKRILASSKKTIDSELKIYKIDRCLSDNCIDLKVNDINLVPLLEKESNIKIDTYLSVKTLGTRDFKYNGFVEVEIVLDLPL